MTKNTCRYKKKRTPIRLVKAFETNLLSLLNSTKASFNKNRGRIKKRCNLLCKMCCELESNSDIIGILQYFFILFVMLFG